MSVGSARLSLVFSCLGHAYMHVFTAFYFVIVLALEMDWGLPYHELIELWTLGALLVGLGALPAGWLADRWSASGMMVVFFLGLGLSGIVCGLLDTPAAMVVGLGSVGLFASIYHPVGIAWLVRNAESRGKALGVNGVFGSVGVAMAGLAAGALIDAFGWRAAFMVPGVVSLATGLALLVCLRLGLVVEGAGDRHAEPPPSRGDMQRVFLVLVLTMLAIGLIFQATQAAMPKVFDLRLRDIAGQGTFGIGAIVAGVYLLGGAMQVIGGHLADRYPLKPIYLLALLFQVPVLAAVAGFAGLSLIGAAVLSVLLSAAALPAENMLLARFTPARHRSLAFGVKYVLAFTTAPLAIAFVAFVQERTGEFVWLFLALAAIAAVATVAAAMLPGERRRRPVPLAAE
ncbi:MAG: MFS transporter [Rhodospirillales bacterium]|nr:MFS transporter [Rhodospirillales bacterium]MDH3912072.1 MFS transporter [Rhodospirillales bacterium]